MKLALIDLFVVTFLACLTVATFIKRQEIVAASKAVAALQAETEQATEQCRRAEHEIQLYNRIIEKRKLVLESLSKTVDRSIASFNQTVLPMTRLKLRDDTVLAKMVPTVSRDQELRERWKIHVPDSRNCELRLSFITYDGKQHDYFEDFEEPKQKAIALDKGENLIEIFYDRIGLPNSYTITNHTNGALIQTNAKEVGGGDSTLGNLTMRSEKNFYPGAEPPKISRGPVGHHSLIEVHLVEVETANQ